VGGWLWQVVAVGAVWSFLAVGEAWGMWRLVAVSGVGGLAGLVR